MYFTEKQLRIMEFIQQFRAERGIAPTLEEIAEFFGVTKITIYEHINQLERKGALKREKFRARSIELLVPVEERGSRFSLPLMGNLRAGSPIEALEERENLNISDIFPVGKRFFALRVRGDEMKDAQIADGDFVIFEKREEVRDGETVVAVDAEGMASLSKFHNGNGSHFLKRLDSAERCELNATEVRGVVIGVLRQYSNGAGRPSIESAAAKS